MMLYSILACVICLVIVFALVFQLVRGPGFTRFKPLQVRLTSVDSTYGDSDVTPVALAEARPRTIVETFVYTRNVTQTAKIHKTQKSKVSAELKRAGLYHYVDLKGAVSEKIMGDLLKSYLTDESLVKEVKELYDQDKVPSVIAQELGIPYFTALAAYDDLQLCEELDVQ